MKKACNEQSEWGAGWIEGKGTERNEAWMLKAESEAQRYIQRISFNFPELMKAKNEERRKPNENMN